MQPGVPDQVNDSMHLRCDRVWGMMAQNEAERQPIIQMSERSSRALRRAQAHESVFRPRVVPSGSGSESRSKPTSMPNPIRMALK